MKEEWRNEHGIYSYQKEKDYEWEKMPFFLKAKHLEYLTLLVSFEAGILNEDEKRLMAKMSHLIDITLVPETILVKVEQEMIKNKHKGAICQPV